MTEYRLLSGQTGPSGTFNDASPLTVGLGFRATAGAKITKLWYWRAASPQGDTGPVVGQVWSLTSSTTGAALISGGIAFPTPAATGWQSVTLGTPLILAGGTQDYRVTVYFPSGDYTATGAYFSTGAGAGGLSAGPLSATGAQAGGFFVYADAFPTGAGGAANYWIDLTADTVGVPSSIGGLSVWHRGDGITGQSDGSALTAWPDSSGNGFVTDQPISGHIPTYKTGIVAGRPVVRFDATAATAVRSSAPTSQPAQTLFAVLKPTAILGADQYIRTPDNAALRLSITATTGLVQLVRPGVAIIGTGVTAVSTSAFSVLCTTYADAATYAFYYNGTADGSGTHAVTLAASGVTAAIGAGGIFGGNPFGGDIAELIVYSAVLSATDRNAVTAYLGTKYGITVATANPFPAPADTRRTALRPLIVR